MIVGITGTRTGLSKNQIDKMNIFLDENDVSLIRHGDCIGADENIHNICSDRNIPIHIHPPSKRIYRAFCESDFIHREKEYLERNRDIVDNSDIVLGFPFNKKSIPKSGTWYTINYCKQVRKTCIIIFPDGTYKIE